MLKKILTFLLFLIFAINTQAQVVYTDPVFPKVGEAVTVFFDASQGTGGLADCNCDVYIHTGVITSESASGSDWKHVAMSWGVTNPDWLLTPVSGQPNLYSYEITPSISDYYGIDAGEEVLEMAFVFRNGDGSLEGKADGGADIYYPVYPDDLAFSGILLSPENGALVEALGNTINVEYAATESATITLTDNGTQLAQTTGTSLQYDLIVATTGTHQVEITANNGTDILTETFSYVVPEVNNIAALPAGAQGGVNYYDNNTVTLVLHAPLKDNVFVYGSFNDWALSTDYQMNRTPDGENYWITIDGIIDGETYLYQYLVDGEHLIADPLSELILDPQNDGFISDETYPNMPEYPSNATSGHVTVIEPGAEEYVWQVTDFERPAKKDLTVYELLVRDFVEEHNYATLIDSLDYLAELGITAIELMPVNEFENNNSWGYNPSYHKALDKYYGTKNEFKRFIDECHARGIAVIVDVVYNHAFGQSPIVGLWFDGKPTPESPYFNRDATHPFNVGYDFNHESPSTKNYVKNVMRHWINEYHLDGFRFDLSKGFTQTNNPDNVGAWGAYDEGRIAIVKDYADECWTNGGDDFLVILEHLGTNGEETEFVEYSNGMLLWGNENHPFGEASMGYAGNSMYRTSYISRQWTTPSLISYMESHDEERNMYRNLNFGNADPGQYDVKQLETGLRRIELVSTFYYTIPGAKMLWQFGEMGYDINIDFNGRTGEKPILWEYLDDPNRLRLHDVTQALIHLRRDYPVFTTDDFELNVGTGYTKRIKLQDDDMKVVVLGNFNVIPADINPMFHDEGTWYEYFTGEQIEVTNVEEILAFTPGEYRLYTNQPLPEPHMGYIETTNNWRNVEVADLGLTLAPNPAQGASQISYDLTAAAQVDIDVFDLTGKHIQTLMSARQSAENQAVMLDNLPTGSYLVRLKIDNQVQAKELMVVE